MSIHRPLHHSDMVFWSLPDFTISKSSEQVPGSWSFMLYMSVALSVIYAILRGTCLWKPAETGIDQ